MGNPRLSRRDSAEILAGERDLTAWHEAGHAVADVAAGLPFHDVQIWVESEQWTGAVRLAPDDESWWVPPEQLPDFVVMLLAGPEAEARRIHQTYGRHVPLPAIRAGLVDEHEYIGGNFNGLPELLTLAGITREEAERRTADMVTAWWPQITRVASILHTTRAMTSAEITDVARAEEHR